MSKIETVRIKNKKNGTVCVVNKSDYNPDKGMLNEWELAPEASEDRKTKPKAPAAKQAATASKQS